MQLINEALFLKNKFYSPNALSFAVLVTVALPAVLLGASKSLAVNIFVLIIIFPYRTIYASE